MSSTFHARSSRSYAVLVALIAVAAAAFFAGPAAAARPVAITSCGYTITAPGQYYLAGDLVCAGFGVAVRADNVDLQLRGHSLTGPAPDLSHGVLYGIEAKAVSNLSLQGPGSISGFYAGVYFGDTDSSRVTNISSTANGFGFAINANYNDGQPNALSENDVFTANVASNNQVHGLSMNGVADSRFEGNVATGNGDIGFFAYLATGLQLHGNTFVGNGGTDARDESPNCGTNVWLGNTIGTSNQQCIR